jgi:hypothetical protein
MPPRGSKNPTSLTNPFVAHVNAAFRWFGFITFITNFEFVYWLITVQSDWIHCHSLSFLPELDLTVLPVNWISPMTFISFKRLAT